MTRFSWHRHLVDGVAYLGRGATPAVGIRGADGLFGPRPRRPPSACGEDSSRCAKAEQCSPASRSNGAQQPSFEHERPRGEFLSVLFGRQALRDAGDDATANAPRSEMPSRAEVLDPVEQPRLRSFPVAAGAPELLVVRVERSRGGRRAAPSAHPACRSPSRTRRSRQLFERLRRQEERLSWLTPYWLRRAASGTVAGRAKRAAGRCRHRPDPCPADGGRPNLSRHARDLCAFARARPLAVCGCSAAALRRSPRRT